MGMIALITLGGCGLAGWILGQVLKVLAELLDVLADGAEAAWRTGDLIEQHLVPTLGRIAAVARGRSTREHLSQLASLAADPRIRASRLCGPSLTRPGRRGGSGRAIELRDALTQHLRGEPLHALDTRARPLDSESGRAPRPRGTVDAGSPPGSPGPRQLRRHARGRARSGAPCRPFAARRGSVRSVVSPLRGRKPRVPNAGPVERATGRRRFREPTSLVAPGASMSHARSLHQVPHRLPHRRGPGRADLSNAPSAAPGIAAGNHAEKTPVESSPRRQRRWSRLMKSPRSSSHPTRNGRAGPFAAGLLVVASLAIVAAAGVAVLVFWPRVKPRPADPVERVAEDYLQASDQGRSRSPAAA